MEHTKPEVTTETVKTFTYTAREYDRLLARTEDVPAHVEYKRTTFHTGQYAGKSYITRTETRRGVIVASGQSPEWNLPRPWQQELSEASGN